MQIVFTLEPRNIIRSIEKDIPHWITEFCCLKEIFQQLRFFIDTLLLWGYIQLLLFFCIHVVPFLRFLFSFGRLFPLSSFFFFFFLSICFLNLFIYGCVGLRFCARAFSSCGKRGPLFIAMRGPLTIVASPVVEHRLQTRRLSNCGSRAYSLRDTWDLPRAGLEPVSPASAGRFSTTAPPGKPWVAFYI